MMIWSMTHKALCLRRTAPGYIQAQQPEIELPDAVRSLKNAKKASARKAGRGASPSSCTVPPNKVRLYRGNTS